MKIHGSKFPTMDLILSFRGSKLFKGSKFPRIKRFPNQINHLLLKVNRVGIKHIIEIVW